MIQTWKTKIVWNVQTWVMSMTVMLESFWHVSPRMYTSVGKSAIHSRNYSRISSVVEIKGKRVQSFLWWEIWVYLWRMRLDDNRNARSLLPFCQPAAFFLSSPCNPKRRLQILFSPNLMTFHVQIRSGYLIRKLKGA